MVMGREDRRVNMSKEFSLKHKTHTHTSLSLSLSLSHTHTHTNTHTHIGWYQIDDRYKIILQIDTKYKTKQN